MAANLLVHFIHQKFSALKRRARATWDCTDLVNMNGPSRLNLPTTSMGPQWGCAMSKTQPHRECWLKSQDQQ